MPVRLPPFEIGTVFGDWTVVGQLQKEYQGKTGVAFSRVRCMCGVEKDLANAHLRTGKTRGCGCRRGRALAASGITHGKSYSPIYGLWASIKHRLTHQTAYAEVKMYEPWRHDFVAFEKFILSLGPKPTPMHTLDRIDPYGNYEPGNLRWADKTEQSFNRRNNMLRNADKTMRVAVGQRFDRLTVEELVVRSAHGRNWRDARVRCDCGTIKTVHQQSLLTGRTRSCGCFKNQNLKLGPEVNTKPLTIDGVTRTMSEWAELSGMTVATLRQRLKRGYEPSRAVSQAVRAHHRKME